MCRSLHHSNSPSFHANRRQVGAPHATCRRQAQPLTAPRAVVTLLPGEELRCRGAGAGRSQGQDPRGRTPASCILRSTSQVLLTRGPNVPAHTGGAAFPSFHRVLRGLRWVTRGPGRSRPLRSGGADVGQEEGQGWEGLACHRAQSQEG